jgi:Flp pilus assembly secretin CpaC
MSVAAGLVPAGVVNALKVTTPQQVMLKVRFVEADRTATRNLGIRWAFFKQNGNLAGVVGTQQSNSLFNSSTSYREPEAWAAPSRPSSPRSSTPSLAASMPRKARRRTFSSSLWRPSAPRAPNDLNRARSFLLKFTMTYDN